MRRARPACSADTGDPALACSLGPGRASVAQTAKKAKMHSMMVEKNAGLFGGLTTHTPAKLKRPPAPVA